MGTGALLWGCGPGKVGNSPGVSTAPAREAGFQDATTAAGIEFKMAFLPKEQGEKFRMNLYDHGCGVVVGDYDSDGRDDIYFLNQLGSNALYRNLGDGKFKDVTAEAGVGVGDRICVGAAMNDYDNDGDQDLYVTSTRGGNILFQNDGHGKFKDVTRQAGVTYVGHSQTPVFFDANHDGLLDLFVSNTAKWTTDRFDAAAEYFEGKGELWSLAASPKEYNLFYLNQGDGTFKEATASAGLKGLGWDGDAAAFDYDEDGATDLFITNMFGRSQLYRNNGKGKFTEAVGDAFGKTPWGAIGAKAFDADNDGHLELFVTDMHSDMWMPYDQDPSIIEPSKKYEHVMGRRYDLDLEGPEREKMFSDRLNVPYEDVVFGNVLLKRNASGGFDEISDQAGLETFWPWGIAAGDFDNNGFVDVFIPTGMGYPWFYWHNSLLMNAGNAMFRDHSRSEGIEPPPGGIYQDELIGGKQAHRSSRCAAAADFDGDGDLDLVVNNFNDRAYLYKNQFPGGNFVKFTLKGTKSNRDAIGAVLRLHLGSEVMVRQVDAAGGYLSMTSKTLHFGLGQRAQIDRAEIVWPSGVKQTLTAPAINTLHQITEPGGSAAQAGR